MRKKACKKSRNFDRFLIEELKDPSLCAEYLSVALHQGSTEEFLVALKNVAEARGGIGAISKATKLNRQSMYRMFSHHGNPTVISLIKILQVFGLELQITPSSRKAA